MTSHVKVLETFNKRNGSDIFHQKIAFTFACIWKVSDLCCLMLQN